MRFFVSTVCFAAVASSPSEPADGGKELLLSPSEPEHGGSEQLLLNGALNPDSADALDLQSIMRTQQSEAGAGARRYQTELDVLDLERAKSKPPGAPCGQNSKMFALRGKKKMTLATLAALPPLALKASLPLSARRLEPAGQPPTKRNNHAMVVLPSPPGSSNPNRILLFGGHGYDSAAGTDDQRLSDMYVSDDGGETWTKIDPAGQPPTKRHSHAMVVLPSPPGSSNPNRILLFVLRSHSLN